MSTERRWASAEMMSSASFSWAGSAMRPSWRVSTNMRMLVSGVRRSWETLFTKSVCSRET